MNSIVAVFWYILAALIVFLVLRRVWLKFKPRRMARKAEKEIKNTPGLEEETRKLAEEIFDKSDVLKKK